MDTYEFVKLENFSLREYNTMRLPVYADIVYMPYTKDGVKRAIEDNEGRRFLVLGNGSNTIFSNLYCHKPIINTCLMKRIRIDGDCIIAESGVTLSEVAWFALEKSLGGFEYLEDIPGSLGGALFMNAGTYEDYIGKQVQSVTVYDYKDKEVRVLDKKLLSNHWGKRTSFFQNNSCFIIECSIKGTGNKEYVDILDDMLKIKRRRYLKQPRNYPSAGSVFKRPDTIGNKQLYVWKLLDESGLRGFRIGGAQVSCKHPGFIINVGSATGEDVVSLMNYCKEVVNNKYGINLEEEWNIV